MQKGIYLSSKSKRKVNTRILAYKAVNILVYVYSSGFNWGFPYGKCSGEGGGHPL
jgi:hypothetical protein